MKTIDNKIIIEIKAPEEKTKAGIYMPKTADKEYKEGTVVEVGPGEKDAPMPIKVGDKIIVRKSAGVDVVIDEKPYTVVNLYDVLVIL